MSASYNSQLLSSVDKVRFFSNDTDTAAPFLSDEEIAALLLSMRDNYYLVAAHALRRLSLVSTTSSNGMSEKQVSDLRIKWGLDGGGLSALQAEIERLEILGAKLLTPKLFSFKAL